MTHGLRVERFVDATPDEVFRAWTTPAALKQWYALNDDWMTYDAEVDLRVGGVFRVSFGPQGRVLTESGHFTHVDEPSRLVYTCKLGDEPETTVTVEFTPRHDGTLVVVSHEGWTDPAQRDMHERGWPLFLDRLVRVVTALV